MLAEKAQLISNGEENFEAPENDDEESKSAAKDADQEAEEDDEVLEVDVEDTGAGEDSDEDDAAPRRGPGGGRALQNISADDGKYLPKLPKKTLPTLNEEQHVLDFYQTFKSQLLRWRVPEQSKLFYWEIVTGHPSWTLARVLSRLIKRIDEVDEDEVAREFERLVQGNKESTTSFSDRFTELPMPTGSSSS